MTEIVCRYVVGAMAVGVVFAIWLERRPFVRKRRDLNSLIAVLTLPVSACLGLLFLAVVALILPERLIKRDISPEETQKLLTIALPLQDITSITHQEGFWTGHIYCDFAMQESAFRRWIQQEGWRSHEFKFNSEIGFPALDSAGVENAEDAAGQFDQSDYDFVSRYRLANGQEIEIKNGLMVVLVEDEPGYSSQLLFDRDRSHVFYYRWAK